MDRLILRNIDNSELWELIDKRAEYILIHQFNPHETTEWWSTSIQVRENFALNNVSVRQMSFDLLTNLDGLKSILNLNSLFLSVYQFNRPVSGTLLIDKLPEESRDNILKQNGLEYIIENNLEDTIIYSFNIDFLNNLRQNHFIKDRILN
jgi:hypothetical protein